MFNVGDRVCYNPDGKTTVYGVIERIENDPGALYPITVLWDIYNGDQPWAADYGGKQSMTTFTKAGYRTQFDEWGGEQTIIIVISGNISKRT